MLESTDTLTGTLPPPSPARTSVRPAIFAPGEVVAERFEVVRLLGQGGMGQVFEARDLVLETRVAVKVIQPDLSWKKRSIERFKREVQVARRVTHPNVCRIFDLFQHSDPETKWGRPESPTLFLTMELVRGETLAKLLRREGALPSPEARSLIRDLAAALAAAHRAGVVHRDFKSGNILLEEGSEGTRVVVTDFGIAEAGARREGAPERTRSRADGTPAYMAPEVRAGEAATAAADVYALGLVLCEVLTGALPRHDAAAELERAGVDPAFRAVAVRCLKERPEERFQSAEEVVEALAPNRAPSRRLRVLAATVLAAALAVTAIQVAPAFRLADEAPIPRPEVFDLYTQGVEMLRLHRFREARVRFEQAARAAPESASIHSNLATSWAAMGWDARAGEHARRAFELSAELPPAQRLRIEGQLSQLSGDLDRAREVYRELWSRFPAPQHGLHLLQVETTRDPPEALATVEEVRRVAAENGASSETLMRIDLAEARAAHARGDFERQRRAAARAADAARALNARLLLAESRLLEGAALEALGLAEEAAAAVAQVREIYEQGGETYLLAKAVVDLVETYRIPDPGLGLDLTEALTVFRHVGDRQSIARALLRLARERSVRREFREASQMLDEALATAREIGNLRVEAGVWNAAGINAQLAGDFESATRSYELAIATARESGNLFLQAGYLANLGGLLTGSDPTRAESSYAEALSIARQIGSRGVFGTYLVGAGGCSLHLGDLETARRRFEEALEIGRKMRRPGVVENALAGLGRAYRESADLENAQRVLKELVQLQETDPDVPAVSYARIQLALVDLEAGETHAAERILRRAIRERKGGDMPIEMVEVLLRRQKVEEARQLLDSIDWENKGWHFRQHGLLLDALIEHASGRPVEARRRLEALLAEAERMSFVPRALRIRLALGRILYEEGERGAGRARLEALAREARQLGYERIAASADAVYLPGRERLALGRARARPQGQGELHPRSRLLTIQRLQSTRESLNGGAALFAYRTFRSWRLPRSILCSSR